MYLGGSSFGGQSADGSTAPRVSERGKSLAMKEIAIDGTQIETNIRTTTLKTRSFSKSCQ